MLAWKERGAIAKTRTEQREQNVELADVWADPNVEEIGSGVRTISNKAYLRELAVLQVELVKLQEWIKAQGLKVAIIFEGRDAAGKGGAIKTITLSLNPRYARVIALPAPSEREKTQWYFQRYAVHLPAAGEMVLFDRKKRARLNVIHHFLRLIPYRDLTPEAIVLPPRQIDSGYVRPPMTDQTFVPEVF